MIIDLLAIWDTLYKAGFTLWLSFFGMGLVIGFAIMFALIKANNSRF